MVWEIERFDIKATPTQYSLGKSSYNERKYEQTLGSSIPERDVRWSVINIKRIITSHVRSWTGPMQFKLKIIAVQAKAKCFWVRNNGVRL